MALTREQTQQRPQNDCAALGVFVLPSVLQGDGGLYMVPGKKSRECQRGVDSCLTDILGACSTPGIIMGLIGRSERVWMGTVNMIPDITVCSQPCHS